MAKRPRAPMNMPASGYAKPADDADDAQPVTVEVEREGNGPKVTINPSGAVEIENDDGTVTVDFSGGKTLGDAAGDDKHLANLAEQLSDTELATIADELLQAIRTDEESRSEWLETTAAGLALLGLTLEQAKSGADASSSSAPVDGMSTVKHPLLLEAVLRFQANARGELLPTDGPLKVRNDDDTPEVTDIDYAEALEKDCNHYLTVTDKNWVPDFDRMLFRVGFGGCQFKKLYHCPIRRRPVSDVVDADDLIVSNAASSLSNAPRITHKIEMQPSWLKRLQLVGHYVRDIDLDEMPSAQVDQNAVKQQLDDISGVIRKDEPDPKNNPRPIYECYCELDIPGFEHKEGGEATGLPLPYRVTIDKTSRKILEIRRNWRENDELFMPRRTFVKYGFVPAIGFYDIGLLHILGNTNTALTAAWRMMLDAGMFANFPGFLFAKQAENQATNQFRVPPGGGVPIDTGGVPISDAVMPLPYKEPGQALVALVDEMAQTGQRVGGTAEINVGEGRQDAPVGTTIALIEQATKIMDAVHKRLHQAQAEEFQLLLELFREDPESFWRGNRKPTVAWDQQKLLQALDDYDLVPVADPNTSSHMMRVMKVTALKQLQAASPDLYDREQVESFTLTMLGFPTSLLKPPAPPQAAPGPDPVQMITAQARLIDAQTNKTKVQMQAATALKNSEDRAADRESKEKIAALNLAKEIAVHPMSQPQVDTTLNQVLPPGGPDQGPWPRRVI